MIKGKAQTRLQVALGNLKASTMSDTKEVSGSSDDSISKIYYSRPAAAGSRQGPASCLVAEGIEQMPDTDMPQFLKDISCSHDDLDGHGSTQKVTMRSLNYRLASYLEKVRRLERANAHLERQIKEWYENRTPPMQDLGAYEKTIADLKPQIKNARLAHASTFLQIENSKRVAKDFRMKYETELSLHSGIKAGIRRLQVHKNELVLVRNTLEMQVEILTKELTMLKKSHEEDISDLQGEHGHQTNMKVTCTSGVNLTKALDEMRDQYEAMTEQNRKDAKMLFKKKFEALKQQMRFSAQTLQVQKSKAAELKCALQDLENELQALHSLKTIQEGKLGETRARYAGYVQNLQRSISRAEAGLAKIRAQLQHHNGDNKALLNLNRLLQREIISYQRLLEGEETRIAEVILKRPDATQEVPKAKRGPIDLTAVLGKVTNEKVALSPTETQTLAQDCNT